MYSKGNQKRWKPRMAWWRMVGCMGILWGVLMGTQVVAQGTPPDKVKPVKNVILLIADGTSWSTISLSRWIQRYANPEHTALHIDPFMTGSVITYCSDAPTGDSAPTTSCYMTGVPSTVGFISCYPRVRGKEDLVPLDSAQSYAPLVTLMELMRLEKGGATGLVVTCQFPHATPADCAAHYPDRGRYDVLAMQMAHNGIDVVIGGGTRYATDSVQRVLQAEGITLIEDDLAGMRAHKEGKFWALFGKKAMPYDIDRDEKKYPSLAEGTEVALRHLSKNKKGFFLMVEGSAIDWAAHDNDPVAMVHDFLAFDEACKVAFSFAQKEGNTAVIVLSDHGNSGLAIGHNRWPDYATYSAEELFGRLAKITMSAEKMAEHIANMPYEEMVTFFREKGGVTLQPDDLVQILSCKQYKGERPLALQHIELDAAARNQSLTRVVAHIYARQSCLGFTTHGHTAEEVFLACYHPKGHVLQGVQQNTDLHAYMARLLGYNKGIAPLHKKYFVGHKELFTKEQVTLQPQEGSEFPTLRVEHKGRVLEARPFGNKVWVDGKEHRLTSLVVYVPEREEYFLPRSVEGWYSW